MSKASRLMPSDTTALLLTAPENELPGLTGRLAEELSMRGAYKYREVQSGNLASIAEQAKATPPESLTWYELSALADHDAEASIEQWAKVKKYAASELKSGQRTWEAIAPPNSTPLDRARFLVLRSELLKDWKPAGMIEGQLIDQMAQQITLQLYWTEKLTQRTHEQAAGDLRDRAKLSQREQEYRYGEWIPERVTEKDMIEEAQANVERYNRMFIRLMRTLRDWRRHNVTIQSAGQVNIGEKQVNTATPTKPPAKKRRSSALRLAS